MAAAPQNLSLLEPGTWVGPWRLLEHVDDGGFGDLYKAELAEQPGSEVLALKLAHLQGDERFEEATDPEREDPPPARKWLKPSDEATVIPRVDELLPRLMSEDREQRGTAGALARELEEAVANLGPEADEPVGPTPSAMRTQLTSHPGPRPPPRWRAEYVLGALAMVALTLVGVKRSGWRPDSPAEPQARDEAGEARDGEVEGDSADAGSTALASVSPASDEPLGTVEAITGEVPGAPLKGQKQPPCDPRHVEINGGCWVPSFIKSPCERGWYEWQGLCYFPVSASKRMPTSGEE